MSEDHPAGGDGGGGCTRVDGGGYSVGEEEGEVRLSFLFLFRLFLGGGAGEDDSMLVLNVYQEQLSGFLFCFSGFLVLCGCQVSIGSGHFVASRR